jgi:tRNA(Phe) wybutosine-synthesizing methylase Tyw3
MINAADRTAALATLIREEVDPEFLPYIDAINAFDFIVTGQSCSSHAEFVDYPGRFGYLSFFSDQEAADWLADWAAYGDGVRYVVKELSQMPPSYNLSIEPGQPPGITSSGNILLTFVWSATDWPLVIESFLAAVRKYSDLKNEELE